MSTTPRKAVRRATRYTCAGRWPLLNARTRSLFPPFACLFALSPVASAQQPEPSPAEPLLLLCTADTLGQLHPCGCASKTGGLAHRARLLRDLAGDQPALRLDCGNVATRSEEVEVVLAAMGAMHYDAMALGDQDLALRQTVLAEAERCGVLALSSEPAGDALPGALPFAEKQVGGWHVAVLALSAAETDATAAHALAPLIVQLGKRAHLVALLSRLPVERNREFARGLPPEARVDVIVSSVGPAPAGDPEQIGHTWLLPVPAKGQAVGAARLRRLPAGGLEVDWQLHAVREDLPPDPEVLFLVASHYQRLAEARRTEHKEGVR